ncbi:MAG: hypothetical protein V4736_13645, partial [Bdellovibrionota bacterium]
MGNVFYLTNLTVLEPPNFITQDESFAWLVKAYSFHDHSPERVQKLLGRVACPSSQVATRGHYLNDFSVDPTETEIFHLKKGFATGKLQSRMDFFSKSMSKLFCDVYKERPQPDELIHVTCTGYVSPSPPQVAFAASPKDTVITHCYHMGCYAHVPALRIGIGLLENKSKDTKCDIFHTELCSLHFQPENMTAEQLVIQSLFADGTVLYQIGKEPTAAPHFEVIAVSEKIIPETSEHMAWSVGEQGFSMTLSKDVPAAVTDFLKKELSFWIGDTNLFRDALWAIHPGGPKILDGIKSAFEFTESQVRHSRQVLLERGNMSSATV